MIAVFADTFYWIALTNLRDLGHERAKALTQSLQPAIVFTTEEVLIEYLTNVLTNDRHFEQEGFRALLRDS